MRTLEPLVLARLIYERAGYRAPARVWYRLRAPGSFILDRNPYGLTIHPTIIPLEPIPQVGSTRTSREG